MKTKLAALGLIVISVVYVSYSQKSEPAISGSPIPGRYKIYLVSSQYSTQKIILDTETGRVWRQIFDNQVKELVYIPEVYESLNGNLSLIPNEQNMDVMLQPTNYNYTTNSVR